MWLIGAATVVTKVLGPEREMAEGPVVTWWDRLCSIPQTYWLNLKSLVWPVNLMLAYPKVKVTALDLVLGLAAIGLTLVVLWRLRRRTLALFGLLWFCLALAPASHIISHHVPRADRFLYLPLVGLAAALAMGLRSLDRSRSMRVAAGVAAACVLGLLFVRSADQVGKWRTNLTLWRHCVSVAPNSASAHEWLGNVLEKRGQMRQANYHFNRAAELDLQDPDLVYFLAQAYVNHEDEKLRDYDKAIQLAARACELTQNKGDERCHRGLASICCSYAKHLADQGDYRGALQRYQDGIQAAQMFNKPYYDLALFLAKCPDEAIRNPQRALVAAERARA